MKKLTAQRPTLHRATGYTILAAAAFTFAAQAALAQEAPPPDNAPAATQSTGNTDPPGRVARLNYTAGAVTTEPAGATDWSYAQINRPLTTGDQLWDDQNARSELHIGSTAVRLADSTSLDILNLDDSNAQLKIAQGTLSTRVRELAPGSTYEIDTPNLALGITGPGDYRVDVAPDGSSTTVTVRSGSATVYGDNGQVPIAAGQQIRFAGTALQQVADNSAPGLDGFDQWAATRDAEEDRSVSARYVSRDVPGYEDLDANGTWRSNPQYGEVWVPNAAPAGWAPYHDGHWVWQAPWGWTWVDDAPWGFAPYHYGRWAYADDAWAWVPGPVIVNAPPVYAPALVAFVGGGGGSSDWGVNLAIGGAAAVGVAWFPLGPGEAWHPRGGDWSPGYYNRVNNYGRQVNITNVTNIHNTYINYRAPGGVTAVPATAFVHGQAVGRFAQPVNPAQWRNAQINPGGPGIAPVRQSFDPGVRNATYRPPAAVAGRPVVATRSPAMPAAYHDTLAQRFAHGGGQVPGAGAPVVRTSVPAHFAGVQGHGAPAAASMQNVRVVQANSPRMAPGVQPRLAQGAEAPPGNGAEPRPANGVPHPPQAAANNPNGFAQHGAAGPGAAQQAAAEARHEPAWTQPHAPMAQQAQPAQAHGMPPQAAGREPSAPQGEGQNRQQPDALTAQQHAVPHPAENPSAAAHTPEAAEREPHAPSFGAQAQPQPQQQQARAAEYHPQQAQQAPREEPRPQPQAQPRQEPRPQQAQQAPREEPRPQPQAQQRQEPRPQQAQQPRPEARPPQQAQRPQPHPEQHSTNDGRDEHRKG